MHDPQVVSCLREPDQEAHLLVSRERKAKQRQGTLVFAQETGDRSQVVGGAADHLVVTALARQLQQLAEPFLRAL